MTWIFIPQRDDNTNDENIMRISMRSPLSNDQKRIGNQPGLWTHGDHDFIFLAPHLHNWLVDKNIDYHLHNSTTARDDFHHYNDGIEVWIDDENIAMLFKLTWGGAKKL